MDIKTGVSGAGREATQETHYVSAADNVNPYKTEGHRHSAELEQELPDGVAITFVPHLIPVDQGLMATSYSITEARPDQGATCATLLHDAYADEPFVDVVDAPPHTSHVRGTNRARVYGTVTGSRVLTVCAIDNLWKGAAGQAVQDLNLMLGLPETEGAGMSRSFARSWVERPEHVTRAGAHRTARGLRERGLSPPGIKPEGLDVGLLLSDARAHRVRRPLHHQRAGGRAGGGVPRGRPGALRAVAVNSGQRQRLRRRARHGDRPRPAATPPPRRWTSTPARWRSPPPGVIARELPRDKLVAGIRHAAEALAPNAQAFSESHPHHRPTAPSAPAWRSRCPRAGSVRLAAQAKGGGMISPRFATMLCFVQTDAGAGARDRGAAHRRDA